MPLLVVLGSGCGADTLDESEFLYQTPDELKAADANADGGAIPSDGGATDGQSADIVSDGAGAADTGPDVAADAGKGVDCATDFDCAQIKGKTPCKLPSCNNGTCELKTRPADEVCTNPLVTLQECEQTRCDAAGECKVLAKPDATGCGFGVCGKLCKSGKCTPATDADYDDGNACTKDFCKQGTEVVHEPITDLSLSCDDSSPCTENEYCAGGKCVGQPTNCDDGVGCTADACDTTSGCLNTPNDGACDDGDPCSKDACDLAAGCTVSAFNEGATCDDGNACSDKDLCGKDGVCAGNNTCTCALDTDCDSKNLCVPLQCSEKLCVLDQKNQVTCDGAADTECAKAKCDPSQGKCVAQNVATGSLCDDGNPCTATSKCDAGECDGSGEVNCNDNNPCTTDACDPVDGCDNTILVGSCDDGNACTSADTCTDAGCVGTAKLCDDGVVCTSDSCDKKTANCVHKATDEQCDDDNPCTNETCDAAKDCVYQANDAGACDDGDACTKDTCSGGKCAVAEYLCACKTFADCDDKNPCTVDTCAEGSCSNVAGSEGSSCNTANKCDAPGSGSCKAGECAGGTAKDCTKGLNSCETGACNPATGTCEKLIKTDGTKCDADGSGCTVGDTCSAGKCMAGGTPDCSEQTDACNVGTCKSTGVEKHTCVKVPSAKDAECDDGQFCTEGDKCDGAGKCVAGKPMTCDAEADTCNVGKCDSTAGKCVKEAKKPGVPCDDGAFCTEAEACDGKGACVGGKPKTCAGGNCLFGTCDEAAGKCATKSAPEGTECVDGNACTTEDRCDKAAKCVGTQPKVCTAQTCKVANCDTKTGSCVVKPGPNGSGCNDGDACTGVDSCQDGACKGSGAKNCQGDACNTGACNSSSGACEKVPKKGTPSCSDGNACTTDDVCNAGKCTAGPYTCACQINSDCDDKNACTKDECVSSGSKKTCKNSHLNGATCNDGDGCTSGDKCLFSTCRGTPIACDDKNVCTADFCDGATGKCATKGLSGKTCSDGDSCTEGDKCNSKSECSGAKIPCSDGKVCTNDSCKDGKCVFANNTATCNDGTVCTTNDKCKDGVCKGTTKSCDDQNTCTADSCHSTTGCQHSATNELKFCGVNKFCVSSTCTCRAWHETSGVGATELFYAAAPLKSVGVIAVGRRFVGGSKYDAMCRTFGVDGKPSGAPVLHKYGTNDDYFRDVARLKDGTFVAVGQRYNAGIGDDEGWIARLDSKCAMTNSSGWQQSKDDQYLQGVVARSDGGAWAVGAYKNVQFFGPSKYTSWFGVALWLDPSLKVVKSVKIGVDDPIKKSKTYMKAVAAWQGWDALVVGETTYKSAGGTDGAVALLASNGTQKYFVQHGTNSNDLYKSVAIDGSYAWLAGYTASDASNSGWQNWLTKIRVNDGKIYIIKTFGSKFEDKLHDIAIVGGVRFLVGRTYDGNTAGSAVAQHFNSLGNITRTKIMKPSTNGSVYEGVTVTDDGRFIAVGSGYDSSNKTQNPWITTFGSALETSCN